MKDAKLYALSNISLRWMVREILKTRCHILFDETSLKELNISKEIIKQAPDLELSETSVPIPQVTPTPTPPETPDMPDVDLGSAGPETVMPELPDADALDAVQGIGDLLKRNVFWWIIEIIPTNHVWQNEHDEWVGRWR